MDAAVTDGAAPDDSTSQPAFDGSSDANDVGMDGSSNGHEDPDASDELNDADVGDSGTTRPLSIAFEYQAQCPTCDVAAPVYPVRRFEVGAGDPDVAARCRITQWDPDTHTAAFSLESIDPLLDEDHFRFSAWWSLGEDASPSSDCTVTFAENMRSYSASCDGRGDSDCHLAFEASGSNLSGSVLCTGAYSAVGPSYDLAAPMMSKEPATFEIEGCSMPDLSKLNADGSGGGLLDWVRSAPSLAPIRGVSDLAVASDGALWLTMFATDAIDLGPDEAGESVEITSDGFVARYTADGFIRWAKPLFTTTSLMGSDVRAVAPAPDASAILVGAFTDTVTFGEGDAAEATFANPNTADLYVGRYRADGSLVWITRSTSNEPTYADDVATHADGTLAVTGSFYGPVTLGPSEQHETVLPDPAGSDMFVARYTEGGALQWAAAIGGPGDDGNAQVAIAPDGATYVAGTFVESIALSIGRLDQTSASGSSGRQSFFLARYETDGSLAWVRSTLGPNVSSLAVLSDGSAVVGGAFLLSSTFGAGGPNEVVLSDVDGEGGGGFIARYSPAGMLSWARYIGRSTCCLSFRSASVSSVATHGDTIIVAGEFAGYATLGSGQPYETTLFDEGRGGPFAISSPAMFVARYEADGTLQWARRTVLAGEALRPRVAVQADGAAVVAGKHAWSTFGLDESNETSLEHLGVFLARFAP